MKKKYIVTLTEEERQTLQAMLSRGKVAARKLMHARILLKANVAPGGPGWNDVAIAEGLDVGRATVERVRKQFVEDGFEAALERRRPRRQYLRKLDGDGEAHLIALACSKAPEGRSRWTLRLLADRMVALEQVDHLSYETVRQVLKKTN
jgi:transposase